MENEIPIIKEALKYTGCGRPVLGPIAPVDRGEDAAPTRVFSGRVNKPNIVMDMTGLVCPHPLLGAKRVLEDMKAGESNTCGYRHRPLTGA